MRSRAFSTAAASIATGALIGGLAASCRLSPVLRADTSPSTAQTGPRPSGSAANPEEPGCPSQGLANGQMLALARHNQEVAARPLSDALRERTNHWGIYQ
jgi:hypothetical protein